MVAGACCKPLTAGRIAGPVQIQGYPDDLEVADYLAVSSALILSMKRSIDSATPGKLPRSHSPSKRDGIARYSSAVILTSISSLMERSMALSGQKPKVQPRRSAIRSEARDCLNASPLSSSCGSKMARCCLHRWHPYGALVTGGQGC